MATQKLPSLVTMVLTMMGLGDVVDHINNGLADGRITLAEGVDIAETLAPHLAQVLPGQGPVITAVANLIAAGWQAEQIVMPKVEALQAAIKAQNAGAAPAGQ